ncbi:hypothetical protein [Aurantibacter aestuarii]|uniref:Lipoprotein n=1 Tax=Aurantibacter aestuarii TaxID=1266046 RepID=A0A2T1NEJ6_9FLAO|nr:hypothetical protein [Aurantibacter aestuarii]PSG90867.1 hypothetical protein C7H52_06230 [Aurantibacter aestuarii]
MKTKFSSLLIILTLFISCSKNDDVLQNESVISNDKINLFNANQRNTLTLQEVAKIHVAKSLEVYSLISEEKSIDMNYLSNIPIDLEYSQLEQFLSDSNIVKSVEISTLMIESKDIISQFIIDSGFESIEEIEDDFIREVNNEYNRLSANVPAGPCENAYDSALGRCKRNWVVSMGMSAVVGVFTSGVGLVTGAGSAMVLFIMCSEDAFHDYDACLGNH